MLLIVQDVGYELHQCCTCSSVTLAGFLPKMFCVSRKLAVLKDSRVNSAKPDINRIFGLAGHIF